MSMGHRVRLAIWLGSVLLGGCTTTTVLESENPSKNRPPQWVDYWGLPVYVQGILPSLSEAQLTGLFSASQDSVSARRVVLFVNPVSRPPEDVLCARAARVPTRTQAGRYAYVAGALCNGASVVTFATANILTQGLTPQQVKDHFEMVHLQLWQALTYGNNHPELVHPSWMYGP